jgi:hypothetical protein
MNYIFGTHVGTQFRGTSIQSSSLKVFKEKIRRLIKAGVNGLSKTHIS